MFAVVGREDQCVVQGKLTANKNRRLNQRRTQGLLKSTRARAQHRTNDHLGAWISIYCHVAPIPSITGLAFDFALSRMRAVSLHCHDRVFVCWRRARLSLAAVSPPEGTVALWMWLLSDQVPPIIDLAIKLCPALDYPIPARRKPIYPAPEASSPAPQAPQNRPMSPPESRGH